MHFATMLSVVGSTVAMAGFAWQKQWLPSLIFAFSLSYTVFDNVFPVLLPGHLVTGLSVISLALTIIFCWRTFSKKRFIGKKRTEILISNSGYSVGGKIYNSRSELATALIAEKVRKVHFFPARGVAYKQVESALEAARDAGITDVGLVGGLKQN